MQELAMDVRGIYGRYGFRVPPKNLPRLKQTAGLFVQPRV